MIEFFFPIGQFLSPLRLEPGNSSDWIFIVGRMMNIENGEIGFAYCEWIGSDTFLNNQSLIGFVRMLATSICILQMSSMIQKQLQPSLKFIDSCMPDPINKLPHGDNSRI